MESRLQNMRLSGRPKGPKEPRDLDSDLVYEQKVFLTRLWTLGYDSPEVTKKIYQMAQAIWGPFDTRLGTLQVRKFAPLRYGQKLVIPTLSRRSSGTESDFGAQWVAEELQVRIRVEPEFQCVELAFDRWLVPWKTLGAYDEHDHILYLSEAPEDDVYVV